MQRLGNNAKAPCHCIRPKHYCHCRNTRVSTVSGVFAGSAVGQPYSTVAVGALPICNMLRNGPLEKSIVDVAWKQFPSTLMCKAVYADW
jgi:hypothetical protein